MKDSVQVVVANASAVGISIASVNEILTLISLLLATSYTIYKFAQTVNDKKKE